MEQEIVVVGLNERYYQVYQLLKSELLQDPAFEHDTVSFEWTQQMLDHNVLGGNLNLSRGVSGVEIVGLLKQLDPIQLPQQEFFLASVLAWCIQWEILVDMDIYFQVQSDYLDCFGDLEKRDGKIGTDIQDFKCSWLAVKALGHCNEEQKKVLCNEIFLENYGKADEASVGIVKALYNDLNLQGVFVDYETEVHEKLSERIQAVPSEPVQSVLKGYLAKIYKRKK